MTEQATRKRDRRTVGKISRRPSAWLAWSLWALIVIIGEVLIIPNQIDWFGLTHLFTLKASRVVGTLGGPIIVLAVLAFATVGAVVATLRPKNGVGWLCLALSLICVVAAVQPYVDAYVVPWRILEPLNGVAYNLLVPPLPVTLMLLIFPDGRLPSRRWWVVVAVALAGYVLTFLGMWKVGVWVSVAALLASVAAVILRWRRSTGQERQQLKWLAYVVILAAVAGLAGLAVGQVRDYAYAPTFLLVTAGVGLGVPAAMGVAVLKYRLYDIDRIINRTLVYGALTALLAGGYFGTIIVLQRIGNLVFQVPVRAITGQEQPSQLVVVVSTLAMAALFGPLRRRIQYFIDRRFYRRKYDARKTLESFSTTLRDETNLEALNDELVRVVRETMQPTHASLWMRPDATHAAERAE